MIEFNADVGEGYDDARLMPYVARVSIACGGHAGDAESMDATLRLACEHGVAIGAHPGYPDREGFGRRRLAATPEQIAEWVRQQTEALAERAETIGARLVHVKPHGALYNAAADDAGVARAVVRGIADVGEDLLVVALSGSFLVAEARRAGLRVLSEAFVDRRYDAAGRLVSRETPGAVLSDPAAAAAQALALARGRPVATSDGGSVRITADTLCLHGDTPQALQIAQVVSAAISSAFGSSSANEVQPCRY